MRRSMLLAAAAAACCLASEPCMGNMWDAATPECRSLCTKLEQCDQTFYYAFVTMEDCLANCGPASSNEEVSCWMTCDESDSCEEWDACRMDCGGSSQGLAQAQATCVAVYRQCQATWGILPGALDAAINNDCYAADAATGGDACLRGAEIDYFQCLGASRCQIARVQACQSELQAAWAACEAAE